MSDLVEGYLGKTEEGRKSRLHDLFPEHVQTKTFWFCPHQIMSLYLYSL